MRKTLSRWQMVLATVGIVPFCAYTVIAFAQQAPVATPVRAVLAVTNLPSVVDAPRFFNLSRVELPPGQSANYRGPVGFVYVLSGVLLAQSDGRQQTLRPGDALLVPAGAQRLLTPTAPDRAVFLHYVLARSAELHETRTFEPASITELYRSPAAIPNLKPGPHELTLTRVTFPPRMSPNPSHYRSGAALYYILAGPGIFVADGKTERKDTGRPHFEPYGWVHQWGNEAETPLVLLQANISQEGVPAVIMGTRAP